MKLTTNRVGETIITHQGFIATIVKYDTAKRVTLQFNDRYGTQTTTSYSRFKNGQVQNPSCLVLYHKAIVYHNDIKNNSKAFEKYRAMMDRCYGNQKGNNAVYKGCEVCEEWYIFENFVRWYNDNYYTIDDEQMDLDKDIFGNGKLYSPQTCVFVPHKLNSQIACRNNLKYGKELPMGVTIHKRPSGNICYRVVALHKNGLFNNIQDAKIAYDNYVEQQYHNFAMQYKDVIPKRLYNYLINFKNNS